jgi:hypothetical protein
MRVGLVLSAVLVGVSLALLPPVAHAAPGAPSPAGAVSAAAPLSGAKAIVGEWMILGPASLAHLPLMMEFTFQDADPTAKAMAGAHLTAEQQQQVLDARRRAAADPTEPDLVEMQAMWTALRDARMVIGQDSFTARANGAENEVKYRVTGADGLQVFVETTDPRGSTDQLILTLPGEGMLMMGPKGEEPIVLRRVR